ncbi:NnrU family protein [Roseibium polysiphoniae]|uniref:NnrU family protein n=1 Tax=Roseibium polysiphoniae TaxID=2571221 RepID=A0A944C7X3_9HYPH|nr:NnrU family protein [Roseibium polysiphoniae]MBS8259136.1 NnrU family protein [Roseibium polysiphoniae]
MYALVIGLAVFLGIHCLPMFVQTREKLIGRFGGTGYRIAFSMISAVGLYLIITGYGAARVEHLPVLYDPPEWTRHVVMLFMIPVFILLIGAYVQGRIKRTFRHPMLIAIKLWAFSHLLVRGDLASVLLFGSFLAWAVIDRISLKRRVEEGPVVSVSLDQGRPYLEVLVILAGLVAYGLFVWKGHELVIGYPLT